MIKMTDAEIGEELGRIDCGHDLKGWWDSLNVPYVRDSNRGARAVPALRLLAASQKALGEIAKKRPHRYYEETVNLFRDCPCCERMIEIARAAKKGIKIRRPE